MSNVKDYTCDGSKENSHYNGVPSMFGRMVDEQNRMQPKYSEPGESTGKMQGDKRNSQVGP